MQIANRLAGYSMGEADLLRRAMGKKIAEEMAAQRERFVRGAVERGFPEKKIVHIFDLMEQFAGYGFNKSHSAAYALLAYQTAYLKTHYPVEFMASLLTSETGNTDRVVKYINECREMGIAVEPPDINVSDANFTPHGNAIRFGLAAVRNVGRTAIESILAAREKAQFTSFFDVCERVDLRLLNRRVLESLIKSGALDSLGGRAQLMAALDKAIERGQKAQRDAESGQHGLFGVFAESAAEAAPTEVLPEVPDWDEHQRLAAEKEVLGFFITGHPLEKYFSKLEDFSALNTEAIGNLKQSTGKDEIYSGGVITNLRVLKSKRGELYAQAILEDLSGSVDMLVFPEAFKRLQGKVRLEVPVLIRGGVRVEEGSNPKLTVSDIIPLEQAQPKLPRSLRIRIRLDDAAETQIDQLHLLCRERRGEAKLLLDVERTGDFMVVMEPDGYNVLPDRAFRTRVEELFGRGAVRVID